MFDLAFQFKLKIEGRDLRNHASVNLVKTLEMIRFMYFFNNWCTACCYDAMYMYKNSKANGKSIAGENELGNYINID